MIATGKSPGLAYGLSPVGEGTVVRVGPAIVSCLRYDVLNGIADHETTPIDELLLWRYNC